VLLELGDKKEEEIGINYVTIGIDFESRVSRTKTGTVLEVNRRGSDCS